MWRTVSLGEVCTISSSKRIFANEYQSVGIPFYRGKEIIEKHNGNNITTELFISQERYEEIRKKYDVPKKGDILLTSVGTLGVPWLVDEENFYFKDGNLTWFRCNSELLPDYLYFWFHSFEAKTQIDSRFIGSTQKALTIDSLKKFRITIPPIDLQKKIISVIRPLEQQIIINRSINENLEQQCWNYFYELFINNADSIWPKCTLSDIGSVVSGGTPSKSKLEYYTEKGISWITPKDLSVNKSKFISHGEIDISELGFAKSNAQKLPAGTVLFSSRAPIGYIAIAQNVVTTNQGFKSIIPNKNIGTAYTYYLLKYLLPTIEAMGSGSTFKEISGSVMKSVPTVMPDDSTLKNFTEFCEPIFRKQEILEIQNNYLTTIRNILLPKIMSGELDITKIRF